MITASFLPGVVSICAVRWTKAQWKDVAQQDDMKKKYDTMMQEGQITQLLRALHCV